MVLYTLSRRANSTATLGGALAQDSAAVGIKLNCSDWRVSEDEIGEQSAAGAGEEVKGLHVIQPSSSAR